MIHLLLYSRAMERSFPCHEPAPAHDTLLCQNFGMWIPRLRWGRGGGGGGWVASSKPGDVQVK